ncbi:MAG TPA: hypothetical protein VJL78_08285 [Candidatus Nitrosocosmicus sp.]|nr:hypothetical protein [Candidatus Nitrosocosmicus sp.]
MIPSILIRTANTLLLMTNPYLQEYIFESTEFIGKRKQDLQIKNSGGNIDE